MFSKNNQKLISILAAVLGLIVLLIYMQGGFENKVSPGQTPLKAEANLSAAQTVVVEQQAVDDKLSWPGSVQSRTVTHIAPRLSARLLEIHVHAGDKVKRGDILAKLDNQDIDDRENQALAALAGANAQADHAKLEERRYRSLFNKEAATRASLDSVVAQAKQSQALVNQAMSALNEVRTHKDDALIRAPFDGIVVKRLQEPGDMSMPGAPVITMQSQQGLRLEAPVPSSCASHFSIGMDVKVRFDNKSQVSTGRVDEIVPEVDTQTRSQLIKVLLPEIPGLQPGSFGWLEQACEQHQSLLIPVSAVLHLGQLDAVKVVNAGQISIRHIRTGKTFAEQIEVLSGLQAGETVIISPQQAQ
ncbi:MAG: efflux RND transporter periplasmic adaptor subunit [Methylococcales bacterium]